jgi:four helix bundle protein
MELAEATYKLTSSFPLEEKFGLTSQMRRCAISIPSNIAEGAGRNSNKQFLQFLSISIGSINELRTQLEPALRFSYLKESDQMKLETELIEISKMIAGLMKKLNTNNQALNEPEV